MTPTSIQVSIVIPAYNEARRIGSTIRQILDFFQAQQDRYEVVVVDDGSTDSTVDVINDFITPASPVRLVRNEGNRGKGFSVRHGALEAIGDIVLFSDADLSSPIEESPLLLEPIRRGSLDVAMGSRALDRTLIGVRQPWLREQSGKIFNVLVRVILGLDFHDTQCGFKAFRRGPMLRVFGMQRIFGFGFDPEILFIAHRQGLRIGEIPVRWNHSTESKVRVVPDALRMFLDLVQIRWNSITGKYEKEVSHDATRG